MNKHGLIFLIGLILLLVRCQPQESENKRQGENRPAAWLSTCSESLSSGEPSDLRNAQCGSYALLENPNDPASKKIPIKVLRLPSVNPEPQADPLFLIAGGPGQSAVALAPKVRALFEDVRKNRDIIFVDQRGTGESNPLNCDVDEVALAGLSGKSKREEGEKQLLACLQAIRPVASYYSTPYAVKDLDAIRQALGYEKINLWGGSYGTRVVLEYMREFPAHTRSAILDGVAPVDIALPSHFAQDGYAALAALDNACAEQNGCRNAIGDLDAQVKAVATQLEKNPQRLSILHPRTHQPVNVAFDVEDFASLVRMSLYSRDMSSVLPYAIHQAANHQFDLLASLIFLAQEKGGQTGISLGMHFSVICAEDFPLASQNPSENFLNLNLLETYQKACAALAVSPLPSNYYEPVKSTIPSLLLSGAADPATPPRWAEDAKQHLTNAKHIVAKGGHHLIFQEGCLAQVMNLFISKASAEGIDLSCVDAIQPLTIYLPSGLVKLSDQNASSSSVREDE